ncbi:NTP transferase domain-containing protein [Planomonospora sp. ID67723]|uniref:molybdenum cofactor guanylyltransferase n=1 Tax=Planomonospora sp. ID67723 TaxID=2738134 RepID=UPI0018C3B6AC|nr:NTP transferase domain-containing protein [Planomonospora sp. ID67723]MBG0832975.1 NTP transferase domain-containing protein [Planomonospora sp. ID67723]
MSGYDALILAGGRASRLGGRDKPGMVVGGMPMIERVAGAASGADRLVVVGPARPGLNHAILLQEDPPGGGPVPALRAGLAEVTAPWVVLLAADLPLLAAGHVSALLEAAGEFGGAGAVLVDDTGRMQWLAGAWRTAVLAEALDGYRGRSLHGLLGPLDPVPVHLAGEPWFDCDTLDDLEHVRSRR